MQRKAAVCDAHAHTRLTLDAARSEILQAKVDFNDARYELRIIAEPSNRSPTAFTTLLCSQIAASFRKRVDTRLGVTRDGAQPIITF